MSTKKHGTREKVRNNKSEVRPNQTKKRRQTGEKNTATWAKLSSAQEPGLPRFKFHFLAVRLRTS